MSSEFYISQSKYSLKALVDVDTLSIVSAVFNYIDPVGTTGSFTAETVTAGDTYVYYNVDATDVTIVGVWKIWATFTDSTGKIIRGNTTNVRFLNNTN